MPGFSGGGDGGTSAMPDFSGGDAPSMPGFGGGGDGESSTMPNFGGGMPSMPGGSSASGGMSSGMLLLISAAVLILGLGFAMLYKEKLK